MLSTAVSEGSDIDCGYMNWMYAGKSLAYTRVDFYNAKGQLAAFGRA